MKNYRKISVVSILNKGMRFYMTAVKCFEYQTYQNTEWVIIDNTGKNMLSEKMEKYISQDERIRLIANDDVLSRQDVLKQAFEAATGEFVAFLEPDDFWVRDKLTRQLGFMSRYKAPLSHTSYAFADDKCNLLPIGCYHVDKELNLINYDLKNPVANSTLMLVKDNSAINFSNYEETEQTDLMTFLLKSGIVSSGMTDVMTLCRPVFEKQMQQKIEDLIKKVLQDNPKDTNIAFKVLEHHAYSALNVDGLKLDPTICIGYDVLESLTRLKKLKI
ncbi:MAG: glycosyltransferase [Alphaproteobacteria bacterium]|nr:glycosyltransferase [Alphaproteobacteria bacterium]